MSSGNPKREKTVDIGHYFKTHWRKDLLAITFIAVLTLLFFWPVVIGSAWIPRGGGDSVSFIFPMYRFAAQSLWQGTIPLWNPFQYAGAPFITDNQTGLFYPPNLFLFLINPDFSYRSIEAMVIWHFFFAGSTMFICLRFLPFYTPLRRSAALLGSIAFMFSSVYVTHIGNLNLIAVAAWLPLTFLGLHLSIYTSKRKGKVLYALFGGVSFGIATLAGHGQMTFLIAVYIAAYALFQTVARRSAEPLLSLTLLGLTAFGTAALTLLPTIDGTQYTARAGFSSAQAVSYSLPWKGLLGLISPNFFGRGEDRFWADWSRVEYGYAGILTLFLAAVAVLHKMSKMSLFFALSSTIFLLLAMGSNTPLYSLLLQVIPNFPFQVPARFVLLVDFSIAALAAVGANYILSEKPLKRSFLLGAVATVGASILILFWQYRSNVPQVPHHQTQMLTAIFTFSLLALASLLLLFLYGRNLLKKQHFSMIAVVLIAIDLISLGWFIEVEWNSPTEGFAHDSPALEYLKSDPGLHRIDIATGKWQPNLPQMENLFSIGGVYNPLELSRYAAYIGSVGYRGSPLYNLLGTKYVIGGKKSPPADTNIIIPVFDDDPQVTVFLNTQALPRLNFIPNAQVVADASAAFDAVHQDNFDPLNTVILESGENLNQVGLGQTSITPLSYEPNSMAFELSTETAAYLLISDMFHPGWKATINGDPTEVIAANYALRALYIPPGSHLVKMWFAPNSWAWGLVISLITWVILFSVLIFILRNKGQSGTPSIPKEHY